VCVCVRSTNKKRMIPKSSNLVEVYPRNDMVFRSNGQRCHNVTKCKNMLKAIEWLAWVCTLSSANRLVS